MLCTLFVGVGIPLLATSQIRMDLPHDDRFLIPPHQEIKGVRSPNMVFFISPIADISEEGGALRVAPGSHKLGPLLPKVREDLKYQYIPEEMYKDKYPLQSVSAKAGETILLNMYTIHSSAQNKSDRIRWSNICRFCDAANMPFLDGDDSLDALYNLKG